MAENGADSARQKRLAIIGAGIVGVSTALILQKEGHQVLLIDPKQPGTGTSFGNAGAIAVGSVYPVASLGVLKKVPKMLLDPISPLRVDWKYSPQILPWILRFIASSSPSKVEDISKNLRALTVDAAGSHRKLAEECGVDGLIRPVGWLTVFKDQAGLDSIKHEIEVTQARGVKTEILNADELRQLEPELSPEYTKGYFKPEGEFTVSPIKLTEGYFSKFIALGGEYRQESVTRFEMGAHGPEKVVTDLGMYDVDGVIVSAGARSGPLSELVGSKFPIDTERGYHLNIVSDERPDIRRPINFGDHGFVLAPMEEGIRLTTGAELAGVDAPPDFRRIYKMLPIARKAVPKLTGNVEREWLGFRPSVPDSTPVISSSPRYKNVWFGFGHGHIGLTLAARTGELLADLVAGRDTGLNMSPYRIDRF